MDLTPRAKEQLQKLRDDTECASYSEVIRRALQLYSRTIEEQQVKGRQLGFIIEGADEITFQEIVVLT